jgi:hypothetical protein
VAAVASVVGVVLVGAVVVLVVVVVVCVVVADGSSLVLLLLVLWLLLVLLVLFLFWVAMGSLLCLEIDLSNGMQLLKGVPIKVVGALGSIHAGGRRASPMV